MTAGPPFKWQPLTATPPALPQFWNTPPKRPTQVPESSKVVAGQLQPDAANVAKPGALTLPPGNVGKLAQWVLDSSRLPVHEVAIVTALALLAGICGRAWVTTPNPTGLNLYIVLIARSAIGKEAMHESIGKLLAELRKLVPMLPQFINFDDYASGPALAKACAELPRSFLNVSSEFGRKMKRMANPKDTPMADLRTVMTKLYSKSGPTSYVGDLVYSEKRHVIAGAVAYSMVGETTPSTLRLAMTQDMMEDGFLSRFHFVEYAGERPNVNESAPAFATPGQELVQGLANVATQAATLLNGGQTCAVQQSAEAASMLNAFEKRCAENIRKAGDNEALRQVWNRAHLKAVKAASLLAVAESYLHPIVSAEEATWAINLITRDAVLFEQQISGGDVGSDDDVLAKKLLSILKEYLVGPPPPHSDPEMHRALIVPRKYLQQRTANVAAFKNYPLRATRALDDTIRSLCDSGYLDEIDRYKAKDTYGFQGRCYQVTNLR